MSTKDYICVMVFNFFPIVMQSKCYLYHYILDEHVVLGYSIPYPLHPVESCAVWYQHRVLFVCFLGHCASKPTIVLNRSKVLSETELFATPFQVANINCWPTNVLDR